mmetsp:Transcript_63737/g.197349  ORF Transcript_63737/g.197349 Transcript_63737/m.197349 type:complete len:225 (+) Transcript_63737:113-787(+)
MAASWEMLRLALAEKDYSMATSTLCTELECEPLDLVPMMSSILAEAIRRNEATKPKRAHKGGAFSRINQGPGQPGQAAEQPTDPTATAQADEARRCWRSGVRSLFGANDQAATAMLADLADEYSSPAFLTAAKDVSDEWSSRPASAFQKLKDIDQLCLQVGKPVLQRYGFSPDEKGDKDFRAILAELSKTSKEIKSMNNSNRRLVFRAFPGFEDGGASDSDGET